MILQVDEKPDRFRNVRYIDSRTGKDIERERLSIIDEMVDLDSDIGSADDEAELWLMMNKIGEIDEGEDEEIAQLFCDAFRSIAGVHAAAPVLDRETTLERLRSLGDWYLNLRRRFARERHYLKLVALNHEELAEAFNAVNGHGSMRIEEV